MNNRPQLQRFFSIFLLLSVLTACQTVNSPTEVPASISTPVEIPVTLTPLPTQPINILSGTPTATSAPFFNSNGHDGFLSSEQQEEIKKIITSYFEMRYQAFSFPQPDGFQLKNIGNLVSLEPDAGAFLDDELAKLALQIKYGELNGSRYVTYKYFLDFKEFSFDTVTELASVLVIEDSETTSENSSLPAQMSGLKHVIVVRKEQNKWKIVSDYYNDFLWRTIRKKDETKDDMLNMISTIEALITPASYP